MNDALPKKIVLATDGSEDAALARLAASDLLSKSTGAELHVVHAWEALPRAAYSDAYLDRYSRLSELQARRVLEEQTELIRQTGAKVAEAHLRMGPPFVEIVDLAEEPVKRLVMGSVSEGMVHHAH